MMGLDGFAAMIKTRRKAKGLSQRALGAKAGLPQSHISKIEAGADLQLSTLIELGRLLDLEIALVPKQLIPVLTSLGKNVQRRDEDDDGRRPMYALDEAEFEANASDKRPWQG